MKWSILIIVGVILNIISIKAQENRAGELIIHVINNPGLEIKIEVDLISSLCWDAIGEPGYYDVHDLTTQYPGSYQTTYSNDFLNWEACWSQQYEHKFGLGYYRVTACHVENNEEGACAIKDYFYIDYRTSDLPENFGSGDVEVDFKVSDGKFYYWGTQNLFPTYTSIWAEKAWIGHITTELEPLRPENLYWYKFFNSPRLQWSHSSNTEDYVTHYEVHRNTGQGWELIATRSAALLYYIDWTINLKGPPVPTYLYYKIRSKNGDRVSDEFSNIVKVAGPEEFGKHSGETGLTNHHFYQYKLEQNYPNPFNPITMISFSLKDDSYVTLQVFDILGRIVKTLVNERLAAGDHQVQFDGSNLESGIYFYEIKANNFRDVKKLILLK